MANLEMAISLAVQAHRGQLDKGGKPYILHPLRLMLKFSSDQEQIVAVLHDALEDSTMSLDLLESLGFEVEVLKALDALTRRAGESYESFVERLTGNDLARKIKIEDIRDNLDLTRLRSVTKKDISRIEKYHKALTYLMS